MIRAERRTPFGVSPRPDPKCQLCSTIQRRDIDVTCGRIMNWNSSTARVPDVDTSPTFHLAKPTLSRHQSAAKQFELACTYCSARRKVHAQ